MRKSHVVTWVAAWAILGLTGCEQQGASTSTQPAGKPRVALLMKARTNPFFERMAEGAEQAADEHEVDLMVLAIDKETDAEAQASQVETVTGTRVDVILIAPADSKAIIAPLLQAQAKGIRIINLDNRVDPEYAAQQGLKIATFIGPDNEEGARKSTAAMIEAMGGKGKVAILEGIRGVDNAEARRRGFEQAVKEAGDQVEVVVRDTAEWGLELAQRKMESIINTHPGLDGVFCANDMMALGAIRAIEQAGKTDQIVVAGYDNLEAARKEIRNGTLHATVEQHPDKMGRLGVENALKLLQGEQIPDEITVPTDLVTKGDLPES